MKSMTKKELVDALAYVFILAHNDQAENVVTEPQFDKLMQAVKEAFNDDESKAIAFIEQKASKLVAKLETHLNLKNRNKVQGEDA